MEFFRQEFWSGLPFPSRGDLPDPGIKPRSPALQTDSLPSELPGRPDFTLYPKAILVKTVEYWCESMHVEQWKRTEN